MTPAVPVVALRAAASQALGDVGALLPGAVPTVMLPSPWQLYVDLSAELPRRHPADRGGVRDWLDDMLRESPGTTTDLGDEDALSLLVAICALGHTYRWDTAPPAPERFQEQQVVLPKGLADPWRELARRFDVPQVGSAWTLHLCNWRIRDGVQADGRYRSADLLRSNLTINHGWLAQPADRDLEAFSLTFVLLEARAGAAVAAAVDAVVAADARDQHRVSEALGRVADGLRAAAQEFVTGIRDRCVDPQTWLELVQPTMAWQLPDGRGEPLPGPNGLQLPSWQVCDILLGVPSETPLARAARGARASMPRSHRALLEAAERCQHVVREFADGLGTAVVRRHYDDAVDASRRFRTAHRVRAARYLRAAPPGGSERRSTGLGIEWRAADPITDPISDFEELAGQRTAEVAAASLDAARSAGAGPDGLGLLTASESRELLERGIARRVGAGEVLLRVGEAGEALWYVADGVLRVETRPVDGTTVLIDRLWPGEVFGEISFLTGLPVSADVVAETDVEIVRLDRDIIDAAVGDDSGLSAHLYRSLAASLAWRLRESAARVTDAESRLAHERRRGRD